MENLQKRPHYGTDQNKGISTGFCRNFTIFILTAFLRHKNQDNFVKTCKAIQELPTR